MNDIQKRNYYQKISNLFETLVEERGLTNKQAVDIINDRFDIPVEDIKAAVTRFEYYTSVNVFKPKSSRQKNYTSIYRKDQKVSNKDVVDLYRTGMSMTAVGRKFGITQQRVSQIIAKQTGTTTRRKRTKKA